ncbi:unnamed protein product [Lactuca saligna]|uniref:Uncharacterized protein n=1 Tax=Lactuca saligna TaxID=75948 RepID=A0AA35YPS9_LACSI|nr:unnamed protein product [Lactuca saligna]
MSGAVISPPEILTNKIKKFPVTSKKFHCPSPKTESRPQETIRGVKKSDSNTGIIYIDSKGDLETQNRFPSPPSFNISHDDDFHLTIVHETSRNDDNALDHEPPIVKETPIKNSYPDTLESVFESTIIQSNRSIFIVFLYNLQTVQN